MVSYGWPTIILETIRDVICKDTSMGPCSSWMCAKGNNMHECTEAFSIYK